MILFGQLDMYETFSSLISKLWGIGYV